MMDETLKGKVALVTGGGSGLGEATARAFAQAGVSVAVVDINEDNAKRVSRDLLAHAESMALKCDVSDADQVFRVVDAVVERFGCLDFVVNAAATDYVIAVHDMSVEQWDRVLSVNLRGPFLFSKAAMPVMQRQKSGHIINVASTAGKRAWGNASAYHASKWGLIGFGRGLGVEGRPFGVRVTTVVPGGMKTHFFDRFPEQGIPMPDETNLQDPANVAKAILFAAQMPAESVVQEIMVTPLTETSWP